MAGKRRWLGDLEDHDSRSFLELLAVLGTDVMFYGNVKRDKLSQVDLLKDLFVCWDSILRWSNVF